MPNHEILGRVTAVGPKVSKFQAGDLAGVGCMVDADLSCPHCRAGNEQFSPTQIQTYGSTEPYIGGPTFAGYSEHIVINEQFALRIPENLDLPQSRRLFRTWARHLPPYGQPQRRH